METVPPFFCAENGDGVNSPLKAAQAAEEASPFLFSEEEIGADKLEAVGEYSGERLLSRRPETYRAVIRMLAEGLSMSSIARALGVSRNTVSAVREREGFSIEQDKKELLRDFRRAARLSVERAIELVPHIQSAKDAAIVAAVMTDKLQLLSGEATARVERVEVNQDKLAEMLAALPVLEAEVVPVTGPCVAAQEQKGTSGAGLAAGQDSVSDALSDGSTYARTAAAATLSATSAGDAGLDPANAACPETAKEGGEGVGIFGPPPSHPTGQGEQKIFDKGPFSAPPTSSTPTTRP
jgi:transcriptional regulator with XRE-family HTH domain